MIKYAEYYHKQVVCLIPARKGSKRVREKNIRLLNGKPLISYSIKTALQLGFDQIILSTDSKEIAKIGIEIGGNRLLIDMRPDEFCTDDSTDRDVIEYITKQYALPPNTILAYLRPTTPFRDIDVIIDSAIPFLVKPSIRCLRCVEELIESSFKTFILENGFLIPITRGQFNANLPNQSYPKTYRNNGYIDLYRLPYDDSKVVGFITPKTIELDTEEDFEYAEFWLKKEKEKCILI
jgi:CMP-N,N'-diacetyllegionaminic acid synthase